MEVFGTATNTFISGLDKNTIQVLNNKATGFHTAAAYNIGCLYSFVFAETNNKNICTAGWLDCKVDEMCTLHTRPMTDEMTPRCPGAEILQSSMYFGYLKHQGLKVSKVTCMDPV